VRADFLMPQPVPSLIMRVILANEAPNNLRDALAYIN
jgi:hypothetical protein